LTSNLVPLVWFWKNAIRTKIPFMKHLMIALAATAVFTSCGNKQEKTAAATETQAPAPIVIEKKVYVPVKTQPVQQQQATANKKGWSKAAKGTVIGAGGGALIGAVVSKKKVQGAIIGGVVGGGTGYAIGRGEDRKDGRVQPRN
jgi:hypothetical protein